MTIVAVKNVTASGGFNDILDRAGATQVQENRVRVFRACQALAPIGMCYTKAGAPSAEEPLAAGAFCIDTTNNDVYVCTDRDTPTWIILAE